MRRPAQPGGRLRTAEQLTTEWVTAEWVTAEWVTDDWQVSLTGTHRDPAHCVPPAQRVPQAPQLALSVVSAASQPLP